MLRDRLRRFIGHDELAESITRACASTVEAVRFASSRPKINHLPFVMVLAEGMSQGVPMTVGTAGELTEGARTFQLQTDLALSSVRVTVFCDPREVVLRGIFCGTVYAHAAIGECLSAVVPEWPVGVLLRVSCEVRNK